MGAVIVAAHFPVWYSGSIVNVYSSVPLVLHCYQRFCLTNGLGCFVVTWRSVWHCSLWTSALVH